jgi:hypothetical protein
MIYLQMQLSGNVRIFDLTDRLVILITSLEARGQALPVPIGLDEAIEYMRASCFTLEMFETYEHLATWVESYLGFRAGEVMAEFRRFTRRREENAVFLVA